METKTGFKTSICNIYAPNSDDPSFFDALSRDIADAHWNKIIVGDYNLVLDTEKDRYDSQWNNKKSCEKLKEVMNEYSLSDTWRIRNPFDRFYSWQDNRRNSASRIDFMLISKQIEPLCENIMYTQGLHSDHAAMFMSMKDVLHERGVGYWKCNVSILQHVDIAEYIKSEIRTDKSLMSINCPIEKWTKLKTRLKLILQRVSRKRAAEKKEKNCGFSRNCNWVPTTFSPQ